jgi:hypothetical protein
MPQTPNYSLRYPVSTDPPNVPADMQNLANDVETAFLGTLRVVSSLPGSGNTNQMLVSSIDWRTYRWTGSAWVPIGPGMPACVLINTQAQPFTTGVDTFVQFDTIEEQSTISGNAMAATGTPGTITIRENGLYGYGLRGQWSIDTSGERRCGITRNLSTAGYSYATSIAYDAELPSGSGSPQGNGFECTGFKRLVIGDVLRPVATQSSGATRWIESSSATGNNGGGPARFWAYKIKD